MNASTADAGALRALVIYCHPNPQSYCAHLRDRVIAGLNARGATHRLADLYASGFDPVMNCDERLSYRTASVNEAPVADWLEHLFWADTLLFIYPTWWFNVPAILKGWLDRVLVPHATFELPTAEAPFRGKLENITRIGAVTTCGAQRLHSKFIGEPGRKMLLRGMRQICNRTCKTRYLALYQIDSSSEAVRIAYADRVERFARSF